MVKHNTRVVYNENTALGVSTDWRLDFYKFQNRSYAQVVQQAIARKVGNNDTGTSMVTPRVSQSQKCCSKAKHIKTLHQKILAEIQGQDVR